MKLRMRGNAVRLRLKRSEVEQIASGQSVVEQTCFPDSVLTYRLDVSADGKFSVSFNDGNLMICLPESEVSQWAQSDQVSVVAEQALGKSNALSVLIEKDFKCLAPGIIVPARMMQIHFLTPMPSQGRTASDEAFG